MPAPDPLPLPLSELRGQSAVRCWLCGRLLVDPVARRWGLGGDCRQRLRERSAPRPGRSVVEQEELPGV